MNGQQTTDRHADTSHLSMLERKAELAISAGQAWEVLADFENVHAFAPGIKASPLVGEKKDGLGACRRCHFSVGGMSMVETVTSWEEGESLTVELTEFPMPFHSARITLSITPLDGSRCMARTVLVYDMKYGALGAMLNAVMIRPMMGMQLGKLLRNIERYAKSSPTAATVKAG